MVIERQRGRYIGRNKSTAYQDLVWTVATAADTQLNIAEQTQQTLATIEQNLAELGSDKTRIVSAQVYISDMKDKPVMDQLWCDWLGDDPQHWPQRACVGVALEGDVLIEITVTAVRKQH
ncbi:RidA family protein [Shewanella sp. Scap07]|uniref:RidA family protein n=1 Tax=Shewanella sp. Scap07 TaxID=2589987 RepID=UPI002118455E|nr:RidA family protein [Shewanella sp. Scap07]